MSAELDTTTRYGPPRLATIAASVLHQSLVSDLTSIQHLVAHEAAVAAVTPKHAVAQLAATAAERKKTAAEVATAAAGGAVRAQEGSGAQEDSVTCGICLDATPTARIAPCRHHLCGK